jgi:2-amino-4-hydroxy-6-hydroxymethyldihydropteridine diphosphokinase
MAEEVYLLLGSNEGDRDRNLSRAVELISEPAGKQLKTSSIYETAAWGKTDQAAFLNQAIAISSELKPMELLRYLKDVEKQLGRVSSEKWGPRVIDIDILLYGDKVMQEPELQLPHPYLPVRRFALLPLAEIAGGFVHPVLQKTVMQLLAECPDESEVRVHK